MESAIAIRDLTVRHGDLVAVDHLSLTIGHGEVVALLGPNGAGKTTTVETLEGYRSPSSGSVSVLGFDPISERRHLVTSMGVMLQQGGVYPIMTPLQALRLFSSYYEHALSPESLLERLGLLGVATTPWRRLSGGEQQRVSLALALIGKPTVLFLDEPTAGVDLHGRHAIREVIAEQASHGTTVLITTHEMAEAQASADRVAILHRGKLALSGSLDELTGGGVFFQAPPGLDTVSLGEALSESVEETLPGRYKIMSETSPTLVAALGTWLAEQGATLGELRSGASLEDTYVGIVGDLALEPPSEPPTSSRRTRRR